MLCSFNSFEEGEYKNTGGTGLRNVWYDDKNNFTDIIRIWQWFNISQCLYSEKIIKTA